MLLQIYFSLIQIVTPLTCFFKIKIADKVPVNTNQSIIRTESNEQTSTWMEEKSIIAV